MTNGGLACLGAYSMYNGPVKTCHYGETGSTRKLQPRCSLPCYRPTSKLLAVCHLAKYAFPLEHVVYIHLPEQLIASMVRSYACAVVFVIPVSSVQEVWLLLGRNARKLCCDQLSTKHVARQEVVKWSSVLHLRTSWIAG